MVGDKMNIVILTSGDFPYGGAAESFVRNLALGLNEISVNVEVVRLRGQRYKHSNDTSIKCSNYLFKKPFKLEFLKFIELILIISYIPFFVLNRKFIKKDDAILLYGIKYGYQIIPFIIFSKLVSIKCVRFIVESYSASTIMPVWWKSPKLYFYNLQITKFDKCLDGVIVLTKFLYDRSLKYGVKNSNLLLIPHFIEIKKNLDDIKINTNILIGFCGTVIVENGVLDLIKAFEIVRLNHLDAKLLIIGKVSADMENKIQEMGIDMKNITFTGQLDKKNVETNLLKCSILVNPRQNGERAEAGFPTKLGEYFAMKKPVVTTKLGDLKSYFTDKKEVVFAEPNNPESLANAIEFIINNPEISSKIAENGYNWAKENLDYIVNVRKLITFIGNLGDNNGKNFTHCKL
jgi:glycosyltransferase involved in cell wall biosynthesis